MNPEILLADDDQSIRMVLTQAAKDWGFKIRTMATGADLLACVQDKSGDVIILDVILPDMDGLDLALKIKAIRADIPIIIISAQNNVLTALRAGNAAIFDYLPKPFDLDNLCQTVKRALQKNEAITQPHKAKPISVKDLPLIGQSPAMQHVYKMLARIVGTDMTVLIQGESGTGKELAARVLHDFGKRKHKPFIALNMGAIPKDLIESELFGFVRGAFTGAIEAKQGKFAQAHAGTLFLDEIGDMPLDAQTRLLRVLQSGEYYPIGSQRPQKIDCRIIAATHRDLLGMVKAGNFREDLYYRLAVVPLELPPLRQRKEDIPLLIEHFMREASMAEFAAKSFTPLAYEKMDEYSWPGNIRELENLVKRMLVMIPDHKIEAQHVLAYLPFSERSNSSSTLGQVISTHVQAYFDNHDGIDLPSGLYDRILREVEHPLLSLTLKNFKGNQIKAAAVLGINRNTLRKKLRDLGLNPRGTL